MVAFTLSIDEKQLLEAVDDKMEEVINEIFVESQQNIADKKIIDESTLLKSGNINRKFLNKQIIYSVPYADSIEFGRIPGIMPPVTPIKGWVRRKLGIRDEKKINRIAWAISQDIKKNGTQPRPFLGPAIERARLRLS